MLDVLHKVERDLPGLLADEGGWKDVFVDYHKPFVERVWRQIGENRIYLHRILPCESEEALFHPHPWPSAMKILDGEYEMAVGYGEGIEIPEIAALMKFAAGSEYEMTNINGWHYVRPLESPTVSLMVTGKPWDRPSPKSIKTLENLRSDQRKEILEIFRRIY